MAVYGKIRHKRPKAAASVLFSDEEGDDKERFLVVNDPIVSPKRHGAREAGPKVSETRSPRKDMVERSFENDITRSPKKLTRFFTQLNGTSDSPMVSPVTSKLLAVMLAGDVEGEKGVKGVIKQEKDVNVGVERKRDVNGVYEREENVNVLEKDVNRVEKDITGVFKQEKDVNQGCKQRDVARSVIINSGSPQFGDSVWDGILDDLQRSIGWCPTIDFEPIESDSEVMLELEMEWEWTDVEWADHSDVIEVQLPTPLIERQLNCRVYGDERSYLDHDEPVEADSDYEMETEQSMITNVDDLRTLGRLNSVKEEMGYLLEGLRFRRSKTKRLEVENKVLITTLIEVINNISTYKLEFLGAFVKRLVRLLAKIDSGEASAGAGPEQTIRDLVYVALQRATDRHRSEDTEVLVVHGDWKPANLQLSPTTIRSISELTHDIKLIRAQVSVRMPGPPKWAKLLNVLQICTQYNLDHQHRQCVVQYLLRYLSDDGAIEDPAAMSLALSLLVKDEFGEAGMMKSLVMLSTHHHHCNEIMDVIYQHHLVERMLAVIIKTMKTPGSEATYAVYGAGYLLNNVARTSRFPVQLQEIQKLLKTQTGFDDSSEIFHLKRYMAALVKQTGAFAYASS